MSKQTTKHKLRMVGLLVCAIVWFPGLCGCGNSSERTTVVALQEQVKNKAEMISEKDSQIAALKKDNELIRARGENDYKASEDKHKEEITNIRELHRSEVAQLKGQNASLQMELGAITREKITLDEIIDQQPSIEAGNKSRSGATSMFLMFIIALMFAAIMILGFKYQAVASGRQQLLMQATGELRRLSNE